MVKFVFIQGFVCMILFAGLAAEEPQIYSTMPSLNGYIKKGLKANLGLNQKSLQNEQSHKTTQEARGKYLPSLSVEARYSRAGGGRTIEIPVGDLMNPVYAALGFVDDNGNPLRIPNETTPFLRKEEHETKLRAIQPLFQPAIYHNIKLQRALEQASEAELNEYRRSLIAGIKSAYFGYLKTVQLEKLYLANQKLISKNLDITQKLYQAGLITQDAVLRAKSDLYESEENLAHARQLKISGRSYFNHLLNRPLDENVLIEEPAIAVLEHEVMIDGAINSAITNREELIRLQYAGIAAGKAVKIAESNYLPGVTAVVDYGFQGESYRFGDEDDYWMASGILSWNLFNGFQDQAKRQQAVLEKRKINFKQQELENQIRLQVTDAFHKLETLRNQMLKARERVNAMREVYRIVDKRFEQGMASQIELIDARTSKTRAESQELITRYDYLSTQAHFEMITASLNLKN